MKRLELYALPEHSGQRIDIFISESYPGLTRNAVQRLCGEEQVLVEGKPVPKNHRLQGGERVEVLMPIAQPQELHPCAIPLTVVYEDLHLLVINKPRGLVVHPAPGHQEDTLVNALLHHCGEALRKVGDPQRPGIVHRLDKMTSGLLLAAKTQPAYEGLSRMIQDYAVNRVYEAVVHGGIREEEGTISAPIGRHPKDRKKMWVTPEGREAVTHFRVLARFQKFTHLELRLETGRTHQIRVHMAHRGNPVAGDMVYGPRKGVASLEGQCLHARSLGFNHPITGKRLELTSQLPPYFLQFLNRLNSM